MAEYDVKLETFAAENDLCRFTEFLGYRNAPFQKEWYDYLQNKFSPLKTEPNKDKRFLLLWPRGHTKTESTSINYVSWLIGNYPDVHVNIVTKTASLAENILTALITRFETDQNFIEIFGRLKPEHPRKWTAQEIIVNRREISKNPTLKGTGLMGPLTGGRSDLIVCDDLIDEENCTTQLQLEKVSTWFNKVLYPTMYPWAGIIVIGTRWSYTDLYSDLLRTWPNQIRKAIQADGTALWPSYWPLERLEQRRKEIGTIFFSCQYQNDPSAMEGNLLKAEWLHSWEQPPPREIIKYCGVDPALGEGDNQSIATLSFDRQTNQAYLEDVWAEPLPFPMFLRKLLDMHRLHNYAKIYFESNAFQKVLSYLQELQGLPITPTETTKDKEQRFIPMSSHFEAKRILVNPLLNQRSEFWMEWVQFPRGQHDDALDSVEIVTRNVVGVDRSEGGWFSH